MSASLTMPPVFAASSAFAMVATTTPFVIWFAQRWKILDSPGQLKIHERPTCRLGGLPLAAAIFTSLFLWDPSLRQHVAFFAAAGVVWIAGFADDLRSLQPLPRLLLQAGAAIILRFGAHAGIFSTNALVDTIACCFWFLLFINAVNCLDGSSGLAAGVAAILSFAYGLLSFSIMDSRPFTAMLAYSMTGATLAFLIFNFPGAKIFLGDSGSYILGFGIAYLALPLPGQRHDSLSAILFPLVASALLLVDLAAAVIRRLRAGRSPLSGDRRHFYDALLLRGWSSRRVALTYYACTVLLVLGGWLAFAIGPLALSVEAIGTAVLISWIGYRLGVFRMTDEAEGRRTRGESGRNEAWHGVARQKL